MAKPTRFTQEMIDEYIAKGYWAKETTSELWDLNAKLYPNKEALIDSRVRLTWAQCKQRSDNIALNLLKMGYKRDDIIFILLPNCSDSFIVRLACEKAGLLAMTALMTIRESEIEYIVRTFEVKGLACPELFRKFDYFKAVSEMKPRLPLLRDIFVMGDAVPAGAYSLEEMGQEAPQGYTAKKFARTRYNIPDVSTIGLTSGTTGVPKTAEHLVATRMALGTAYHLIFNLRHEDIVLNVINAVAGLGGAFCYSQPRGGATTICMEVWDAEDAFKLIQKERATIVLCAPAQLAMAVRDPGFGKYDFSSLRGICTSTSVLTYELAVEAEEKFKVPVMNAYGTFDGGGISKTTIEDDLETRRRTVGKPHLGVEVKIVDDNGKEVPRGQDGELIFRGSTTTAGYFRDMQKTLEAWKTLGKGGWFYSGDLAKLDEKGNIILTGRKKDVFKRGGQNVYPPEIEGLLTNHPTIDQAAVIGMPDPIMGEKGCAYVVLKKGQCLSFEEMKSFLQSKKIAPYKIPERLEIIDELPMKNFKVVKGALREDVIKKLKAEGKI